MQVELLNDQGQAASNIDVLDTVFGRDYNESLVHQIVVAYRPTHVKVPVPKKTVARLSTQPRSRSSKRAQVVHVLV